MKKNFITAIAGMLALPLLAAARSGTEPSMEELRQQIAALMEQIAVLQTQISQLQGQTGAAVPAGYSFIRDLYYGMRDDQDVIMLQDFLRNGGFLPAEQISTGNYLSLTEQAVKDFQQQHGIAATGYFGPITREEVNALLVSGSIYEAASTGDDRGTGVPTYEYDPNEEDNRNSPPDEYIYNGFDEVGTGTFGDQPPIPPPSAY